MTHMPNNVNVGIVPPVSRKGMMMPTRSMSTLFQSAHDVEVVGDSASTSTSGNGNHNSISSAYADLISEVGLEGELSSLDGLEESQVTCDGVFCNRELKLGNVRAIGFDMDYTIAQYKQPAFDKLAFDGAKEKLVQLGYPKEMLDVEYDHTVRILIASVATRPSDVEITIEIPFNLHCIVLFDD